jgi:arylsulfatase
MISYLDDQVGELVAKLKELGQYENTLIFFTSDNGPTYTGGADTQFFNSAKPFKTEYGWGKGFTKEGGIRVPMIASWPGHITPGSVSAHPSAFWDYLPTFCEAAGMPVPEGTDGISFLPTLRGQGEQEAHPHLYWEFPESGGQQAVRLGEWKAVRRDIHSGNLELELYDLEHDPAEEHDVSDAHPEVVREMERIMEMEHQAAELASFRMSALGDPG